MMIPTTTTKPLTIGVKKRKRRRNKKKQAVNFLKNLFKKIKRAEKRVAKCVREERKNSTEFIYCVKVTRFSTYGSFQDDHVFFDSNLYKLRYNVILFEFTSLRDIQKTRCKNTYIKTTKISLNVEKLNKLEHKDGDVVLTYNEEYRGVDSDPFTFVEVTQAFYHKQRYLHPCFPQQNTDRKCIEIFTIPELKVYTQTKTLDIYCYYRD